MRQKRITTVKVLMLIGLMICSLNAVYMPHHHHGGKFCMEQDGGVAANRHNDDEGHSEQLDVTLREDRTGQEIASWEIVFHADAIAVILPAATPEPPTCPEIYSDNPPYSGKLPAQSHGLRGSPIFS